MRDCIAQRYAWVAQLEERTADPEDSETETLPGVRGLAFALSGGSVFIAGVVALSFAVDDSRRARERRIISRYEAGM